MTRPTDTYHDASYVEDRDLTADVRRRLDGREMRDARTLNVLIVVSVPLWLAFFMVQSQKWVPLLLIAALLVFVLMIRSIVRINREGDRVVVDCPGCDKRMVREDRAGREFHVCHGCKIYALGRDWS